MSFDIIEYLNKLPLDTKRINVSNKQLIYLPNLSRFKNLQYLDCSNNHLTTLPELNDNLLVLNCENNKLVVLPKLNNKLQELNCKLNYLTA